jgi:hypothetical protein
MTVKREGWRVKGNVSRRTAAGLLLLLFTLYASPFTLHAASSNAGTSGAAFLSIAPGARPVGMGQAYTGVADDIDAIYWNPAGLARMAHPELEGMHMQYFQNIGYEYAAFAYPTENHGTWGMAITNLHTDDIQARTQDSDTPAGTFSAVDSAYYLSYAYPLTSKLSLGANLKWVRQSIDDARANAYAGDGGVLYDTGWHAVRLGASLQNIGTRVKFNDESDPLPLTYRFGVSAPAGQGDAPMVLQHLLLSSDLIVPRDSAPEVAVGGEYKTHVFDGISCALRSGYQSGSDVDGLSGVSVGAGLTFGRASFDFAWVPFGELGNTYRYSLHLKFGASGEPELAPEHLQKSAQAPASPAADPSMESLLSLK